MNTARTGDRDTELRATLVSLPTASQVRREPRVARTALFGILAFTVAGALTGGAVSTIASADSASREGELSAEIMGVQMVGSHTTLFGEPFLMTGSGDWVLDLGEAPIGASQIAVASHCNDPGTFAMSLDGAEQMTSICTSEADTAPGHGGGGSFFSVAGDGAHSISIEAPDGASLSLWVSWAQQPEPPARSDEQVAELSDGVVSAEEYRAAFDRFAACMAEAGYPVQFIDDSQPVINYSTTNDAYLAGVDALCYEREFMQVDMAWQLSQE